jgi:hypothetical protein
VSAKRGERAAPPPGEGEYDVRFADNDASKGWEDLCSQAATNLLAAWRLMRSNPNPAVTTQRHHRLKGTQKIATYKGKLYPQWQIEVTGGGRIWYLLDEERRTCWITYAGTGHPKATD